MERGSDLRKNQISREYRGISGESPLSIAGALWAGERGPGVRLTENTYALRIED
jgi:hypothetical protein